MEALTLPLVHLIMNPTCGLPQSGVIVPSALVGEFGG